MAAQRRGKSTKNKFYSINWTWTDQYPVLPKVTKNSQFLKKIHFRERGWCPQGVGVKLNENYLKNNQYDQKRINNQSVDNVSFHVKPLR